MFTNYTVLPFVCPIVAFLLALIGVGIKPSPEELAEELEQLEEEENEAFIYYDVTIFAH